MCCVLYFASKGTIFFGFSDLSALLFTHIAGGITGEGGVGRRIFGNFCPFHRINRLLRCLAPLPLFYRVKLWIAVGRRSRGGAFRQDRGADFRHYGGSRSRCRSLHRGASAVVVACRGSREASMALWDFVLGAGAVVVVKVKNKGQVGREWRGEQRFPNILFRNFDLRKRLAFK